MKKNILLLLIGTVFFLACEEDVILDLGEIDKKLVVEAYVTDNDPLVSVALSYSQDFYDQPDYSLLSNANVILSLGDERETLTLNNSLHYVSRNLKPQYGQAYTLTVAVDDQKVSLSTKLPGKIEIASVLFVSNPFFGSDSLNTVVNAFDEKGVDNYFRLFLYKYGEKRSNEYYVVDDTFGKDAVLSMPVYYKNYELGDTIIVELRHLNKVTYDYYSSLSENIGGSFNSIAPGNPVSNLPDDVFGIFGAYTTDIDTVIVGS